MDLYKEQILQRIENDRTAFDESFFRLASVITGDSRDTAAFLSDLEVAKNSIGDILKFFHLPVDELPPEINTVEEQLEYTMRPAGIMRRRVELTGEWYKDGIGPLLGSLTDGSVVALLPGRFSGYSYKNYATGETVKVNAGNAADIDIDAMCFYSPLPQKKLAVRDLVAYMVSRIDIFDVLGIAAATLVSTLLGMITPFATRHLMSNVIISGTTLPLIAFTVLLLGAAVSTSLINITAFDGEGFP
jgi:hypothetical protein